MSLFEPDRYGPVCAALLPREEPNELGPGVPHLVIRGKLASLELTSVVSPHAVMDPDMARGCLAGLWLLYDFLDESHAISQQIPTSTGSYWHAIMHRREGDYSNSKYWVRRVGEHPIDDALYRESQKLARTWELEPASAFLSSQTRWDPMAFVDLCAHAHRRGDSTEDLCRRVAQLEWQLLFDFCYRRAISG